MKTIEDAVVELDGKLPDKHSTRRHNKNGWYILENKTLTHINEPVWFNPKEFESEAKRLGYINGYRWGVEYPTNGKRPDLPDDVVVCCYKNDRPLSDRVDGFSIIWDLYGSFRITDQRFKPADTSYLNQCKYSGVSDVDQLKVKCMHLIDDKPVDEASGPLHVSLPCGAVTTDSTIEFVTESPSTDFPFERANSNWHERGDLPPAGVECGIGWNGSESHEWYRGVVAYRSEKYTVIVYDDGREICYRKSELTDIKFRPIKTQREKVVEVAVDVICKGSMAVSKDGTEPWRMANALYDAGILVLPQDSSDTED